MATICGIVGTRARAVEWTSAATARRKHELPRVCLSIQNTRGGQQQECKCTVVAEGGGEGPCDVLM